MIEPAAIYYEHCNPGWHVPPAPAEHHILLLLLSGEIVYNLPDRNCFTLSKGDMLFIPAGTMRYASSSGDQPHDMYAAHFRYAGSGEGLPLLEAPRPLMTRLGSPDYMKHRFTLLTQHWLRKSPCLKPLCHGMLLEMLAVMYEEACFPSITGEPSGTVAQLKQYILDHYRDNITVQDLAAYVGLTPNYISGLFRQETGVTLTAYIRQIRISAACDLLTGSQMKVGEISDYLGFCEPSYFNKVFKTVTGMLPSAYAGKKVLYSRNAVNQRLRQ